MFDLSGDVRQIAQQKTRLFRERVRQAICVFGLRLRRSDPAQGPNKKKYEAKQAERAHAREDHQVRRERRSSGTAKGHEEHNS
jgi:hypothetical protein